METKFMTPTEVWENFNPIKEPLETYIEKCQEKNGYLQTEMYFTSETVEDGKVRVYAKMLTKPEWTTKHPAIMLLINLNEKLDIDEIYKIMLDKGYVVFFVDYAGFADIEKHTSFPKSLDYAKFKNAKHNLRFMGESARITPWFTWAKIARRAITLMQEQTLIDPDLINVLGYIHGAQLAWIVSAIDGRINATIPIMGHGYNTYEHGEISIFDSEEDRTWVSGICPENYARFISCPILYTTSTNCYFANIDKLSEMVATIPSKHKNLCISPKTYYQINKENFVGMTAWTDIFFKGKNMELKTPTISYIVEKGKLVLKLNTDLNCVKTEAFVSFDYNIKAPIRDWFNLKKIDDKTFEIIPYDNSEKIIAFANVTLESGILISTSPVVITSDKFAGAKTLPTVVENNRIVYTNKKGLGSFTIESYAFTIDNNDLKLKTGPHGIKGVMTENGYLTTNKLMKSKLASEKNSILKIDFFSPSPREIRIQLYSFDRHITYTAKYQLKGGERWQKVLLFSQDFKTENGKPLDLFSETQITIFKNIAGVLLNNIIWI